MKNQIENQNQIVTNEKSENQKETFIFEPVAPHPEPVAIGELLSEIEATIKRHVVLSDAAATALAVWVAHTYVYELRDTVAYVAIESPEKRCGKTTLLTVLAAMANKPLIASNVTVGALFRAIDTCGPTLFIDEADTFLAGNGTMRGIINSGNARRTAFVLRLSKSNSQLSRARQQAGLPRLSEATAGLQRYSCWCPKAIAMIGKVPDTIADRSIVVQMVRKLTSEKRVPLAALNATNIRAKCARFALDHGRAVAQYEKIHGDGLNDRAADTFDPLYVIARLAGKECEHKLHTAALALAPIAQSRSSGTELLQDIYAMLVLMKETKMFTRVILTFLKDPEFAPASLATKYSGLDEIKIAQSLRPYGIKPIALRIGKSVAKGYSIDELTDAVARYVPKAEIDARIQDLDLEEKVWDGGEEEMVRSDKA
jgi:putative DNA primase/helicase